MRAKKRKNKKRWKAPHPKQPPRAHPVATRALDAARDNLGKVALGAAAAGMAAASAPAGLLSALFGTLGLVFSIGIDAAVNARKDAAARFLNSAVRRYAQAGVTEAEVKGLLESQADEPTTREAIFEAAKRLMDAACPEAAVPMGALFAEYTADGRAPDAFYRGALRCLADLASDEYVTFVEVILAWADVSSATKLPQVAWNPGFEHGPCAVKAAVIVDGQWKEIELGTWMHADRVIEMLHLHGLGTRVGERARRTDVSKTLTHHAHLWSDPIQMREPVLQRLSRLLR